MTGVAVSGVVGNIVVGALPTPTGSAGIKAGFSRGVANVGTALPTVGKVKGTTMVLKSLENIKAPKMKRKKRRKR